MASYPIPVDDPELGREGCDVGIPSMAELSLVTYSLHSDLWLLPALAAVSRKEKLTGMRVERCTDLQ